MADASHSPGGTGKLFPDATLRLLDALAAARADIEEEDGKVLAVRAVDAAGRPAPALFTTDHYREIYGAMRPGEPAWPTNAKDVTDWLLFANIQCPECNPPESDW